MRTLDATKLNREDNKILLPSAIIALLLEFTILTAMGIRTHWLAHPQTTGLDATKFIEAEVYQVPQNAKLVEEKKIATPKAKEMTLSQKVESGRKSTVEESKMDRQNQTDSGPAAAPNHGPIAVVAPPPLIPSYLQDKDINTSVVIEFLVNNQGQATPRLIGSSGNEELDAIALAAVKKWQFRPAEQNHKPIDAPSKLENVYRCGDSDIG